ncbi:MAG: NUDIX hydrolase [Candidatus Moranbacteria bacterium]|nr:NUDIX hydrolase [Candidatus Moranbacteria bacterium]
MVKEITKTKEAARVVVFDNNERIALLSVRGGEFFKIPGGAIEENESLENAARREALEECGCDVKILNFLGNHEFFDFKEGIRHYSTCYMGITIGEKGKVNFDKWEKENDFCLQWVSFDEAVKLFENANPKNNFSREINNRDFNFLLLAKNAYDNQIGDVGK